MTTEAFVRLQAAVAEMQRQVDALATAHDARAEAAQAALDDLRDIVCDPANPRNHESRLTAVETRTDRTEQDLRTAARERRGLLDTLPSGEEIGKIGDGLGRFRKPALAALAVIAALYLLVFGDPITAIERLYRLVNPPVQMEIARPVPVVPADPSPPDAP